MASSPVATASATAPREMDVYLIGDAIQFFRKVFTALYEQHVRQALSTASSSLSSTVLKRLYVCARSRIELVRIRLGGSGHKAPVAGPDVYHDPFAVWFDRS